MVPDIITLSKALTGGTMALSAAIARTAHLRRLPLGRSDAHALMHGPTFMANPLACAAALASLDLFESEPRLNQVARIGRQLTEELASCAGMPGVRDVRVRGAIGVVELHRIANLEALKATLVDQGVWVRPFGRTLYLTPSFTITPAQLTHLTGAVSHAVQHAGQA